MHAFHEPLEVKNSAQNLSGINKLSCNFDKIWLHSFWDIAQTLHNFIFVWDFFIKNAKVCGRAFKTFHTNFVFLGKKRKLPQERYEIDNFKKRVLAMSRSEKFVAAAKVKQDLEISDKLVDESTKKLKNAKQKLQKEEQVNNLLREKFSILKTFSK